jgi:hypothetical protein
MYTDHHNKTHGFPQSWQGNAGILPYIQAQLTSKQCISNLQGMHPAVCIYMYIQQMSNQLITTFVWIEFINYVKITWLVSAHLEPSSGDTLFKAVKYWTVITID